MLQVVIPMAGCGQRFLDVGYTTLKTLLPIRGTPMIRLVIQNIIDDLKEQPTLHLICREATLGRTIDACTGLQIRPEFTIVGQTEGAACTVLHTHRLLDQDDELLVVNSDQLVDFDIVPWLTNVRERKLDGSLLTFPSRDPKWSFARTEIRNEEELVVEVAEKRPICDNAIVGIHYWSKARYFVDSALDMIIANSRVNNEFYVVPSYQYLINAGGRVGQWRLNENQMHGLGTPEDYEAYLKSIGETPQRI